MKHSYRTTGSVAVVELNGKLMGESDDLKLIDMIDKLIAENYVNIVMDFSGVEWTNSRGVGICLTGRDACKQSGGELIIAGARDKVLKIFDVTNMRQIFEYYDSVDEAISSFE